mgnify:CR=1 FL=1
MDNNTLQIRYKRLKDTSPLLELEGSVITMISQCSYDFTYHESDTLFQIEIEMPESVGAFANPYNSYSYLKTNRDVPPGYCGIFRSNLYNADSQAFRVDVSAPNKLLELILYSTDKNVDLSKIVLVDNTVEDNSYETLYKNIQSNDVFVKARSIARMLKYYPDEGKKDIIESVEKEFEVGKSKIDINLLEGFLQGIAEINDESLVELVIRISDSLGPPLKRMSAKVLSNYPTNKLATEALIRAYNDITPYGGSYESESKFDYAYESDICSALCKMDDQEIVSSLYTSLLRGSREKNIALEKLLKYESKNDIIDYFSKHLNDKNDWRDFTNSAENSKWIIDQLNEKT